MAASIPPSRRIVLPGLFLFVTLGVASPAAFSAPANDSESSPAPDPLRKQYKPRKYVDTSGLPLISAMITPWKFGAPLPDIAKAYDRIGYRLIRLIDPEIDNPLSSDNTKLDHLLQKATLYHSEGEIAKAYDVLKHARALAESRDALAIEWRYSVIYFQGVASLRQGEIDNCIHCRGTSACIFPLAPSAIHTNPAGSRQAIHHFLEYLNQFPDDHEIRWLFNLAHMTLGEYPDKVPPAHLIRLDRFTNSEFNIGQFRDISHLVGVDRHNQAGGAVMDDFDNDGLLDLMVTCWDPAMPMAFYRNKGDGTFEDRAGPAGLSNQLGGLNLVQADYNNDGHLDLFIPRGPWLVIPMRPTLLKNNGNGTFTDVTESAGLIHPLNSNSATFADYDNDGHLDLFISCEAQPNRLYRNKGDGTFEEVAARAGLQSGREKAKGAAWIDYDNDNYPDLYINNMLGVPRLHRNNRNGTFTEVTQSMGIAGLQKGFSCWAFDYNNDGFLDIFAAGLSRSADDVVKGLLGLPIDGAANKLFRNAGGKAFEDVTKEAGLDLVFTSMGTNFSDFDNDGYLDLYLGTGAPSFAVLVPNRMFKNVAGQRFADITASSRTGHLQKGHGVACGDWNRDGSIDIFIQTGGAVNGDKYHNVLFQNPGQSNNWLTLKLIGQTSNRSAIGARIKIVTAGPTPLTIHRHITSGSSFGANPLEQMIGLGKSDKVALLEIYWPTSNTTQTFKDIPANQCLEITEFSPTYRQLPAKPIPIPK